jgi:hypothetical protein
MLLGVSAVLLLLSTAWLTRGFKHLVVDDFRIDLSSRWREQRYIYKGQNPNDLGAAAGATEFGWPLPDCPRDRRIDPDIGPIYHWEGCYPGWSYFTGAAFVLPTNFKITRLYFGFLNVLALAVTSVWAYGIGRPHGAAGGVLLAASVLAVSTNYNTLNMGQYSLIVNGLLVGAYYFLVAKPRPVAAGVLYGLAAIKPHMSALFALVFLVRKQWTLLATTACYMVFASLCIWELSKTDPLEMLTQAVAAGTGRGSNGGSCSLLSVLLKFGVDRAFATRVSTVVGLIAAGWLMWIWRNAPLLTLFAIAATIGRLWTYHHEYDDVMLIFLLVALGQAMFIRNSTWTSFGFFIVGAALWCPVFYIPWRFNFLVQIAEMSSWLAGLVILLAAEPRDCRREGTVDSAPALA